MKMITVHGSGTHYDLSAFRFTGHGKPDQDVIGHAGFREHNYIGIIRWSPDPEFGVDTEKGYAPHVTKQGCPILNAAVNVILHHFDKIPDKAHMEVEDDLGKDWNELYVEVTEGNQFR
jgi:hypothetical protein